MTTVVKRQHVFHGSKKKAIGCVQLRAPLIQSRVAHNLILHCKVAQIAPL